MRFRYATVLSVLAVPLVAAQTGALPTPWLSADVGAPAGTGASEFADDTFTVTGGGDLWGSADAFHLVSRPLRVDGVLTARVDTLSEEPDWAKAGLVMRSSADPGAPYAGVVVSNLGVHAQVRPEADGETEGPVDVFGVDLPTWLRLTRIGTSVTAEYSADGDVWTELAQAVVPALVGEIVVGLAVSSADYTEGTTSTAGFTAVRLTDLDGNVIPVASEGAPAAGFALEALAPNPASGPATARVRVEQPGPLTVEVFDVLGRRVAARRTEVGAGRTVLRLPTEAVPPGSYVVRLTAEPSGATAVRQIVVLR